MDVDVDVEMRTVRGVCLVGLLAVDTCDPRPEGRLPARGQRQNEPALAPPALAASD